MDNIKAAFRTAVGGYNKQDVNNYIAGLCERFESEKKTLEERNAELEKELAAFRKTDGTTETVSEQPKPKNPRAVLAALLSADKNDGAETQAANTSDHEMLVKAEALVTAQNARLDEQKKTISERDSEISRHRMGVSKF